MTFEEKIDALAGLLRSSKRNFAFTGAGVSTESGIPDFRSPGTGLWEKINPAEAATVSAFRRDPAAFYRTNLDRWMDLGNARPNAAHKALALLEEKGYLVGVITQNVDSLHQKAGSKRVWEVHGHLRTCRCLACRKSYSMEFLVEQYKGGTNPPLCAECKGLLRPDVVLFEDPMSEDFYHAAQALTGCDLLLVVGSSLQVYPAASLPERAGRLVIINRDPTPWDGRAALVINDSAGKVFTSLMAVSGLA